MTSSIDLILLPLVHFSGQEQPTLPGLYIASSPRRPARNRDRDQLILYLALEGNAPLGDQQIKEILYRLAHTFYKTSGSVTAAQRAAAESLNLYLLDRNLKSASTGQQAIGLLTQVVLHDDSLYLGQSGPTHAYLLSINEARYLYDPHLAGRGLGLTRTTAIRFSQTSLQVNDAVLLTPQPSPPWSISTLQSAHAQGPESLRIRLLKQTHPELSAVLIQAQAGKGQIHLLRPVRAARPRATSPEQKPEQLTIPSEEPARPEPFPSPQSEKKSTAETTPSSESSPIPIPEASPPMTPDPTLANGTISPESPPKSQPISPPERATRQSSIPKVNFAPMAKVFSVMGGTLDRVVRGGGRAIGTLIRRVLPDTGFFSLPASTMAFVAIAVPLIVVTAASVIYFQRGRAAQYEVYFSQAEGAAQLARAKSDPQEQREAWSFTLNLLTQAEVYQTTSVSKALRSESQGVLDSLDYVERLAYQPALSSGLKEDAIITRMIVTESDLYLLNATEGVVLRATLTSNGFVLDPTFQCGPGPYGSYIVGAITDIAPMPRGNEMQSTLLGMDANGNLLYCIPGDAPLALAMIPPDTNWGTPQGLTQDTGDLYILDPQTNAVWIYRNMDVTKQPRLFFGDQIPPMQDVIGLAVNQNDLYLLHEDSHLTTCTFSAVVESPTRCEDPTNFTDPRPGRQNSAVVQDTNYTQILFSPPPDPSIYLFDPDSQAIYHFSVKLTMQRQYRSNAALSEAPATAFAVNLGNSMVFMAIGNQVYYAVLP